MNNPTSICLPCGLCCNGTLLGVVQLENDEVSEVKKFKEIEEWDGSGFFFQPCPDFCDSCTIYDHRPKQCALFKCGLLKAVENHELDFDVATEAIETVKNIRSTIETQIEELEISLFSKSFYFKTLELKKELYKQQSISDLSVQQQEILSNITEFDELISSKFNL